MPESDTARSIFNASTQEELEYFQRIDEMAKNKESRFISNGKPAHAVYLIYKLLRGAERTVTIFTGKLRQQFNGVAAYADPLLGYEASRFLRKENSSLSIIVEKELDVEDADEVSSHPFIRRIMDSPQRRGTIEVLQLGDSVEPEEKYHFIVADNRAFRLEINTDEAEAIANFWNVEYATQLNDIYDRFRQQSKRLFRWDQTEPSSIT